MLGFPSFTHAKFSTSSKKSGNPKTDCQVLRLQREAKGTPPIWRRSDNGQPTSLTTPVAGAEAPTPPRLPMRGGRGLNDAMRCVLPVTRPVDYPPVFLRVLGVGGSPVFFSTNHKRRPNFPRCRWVLPGRSFNMETARRRSPLLKRWEGGVRKYRRFARQVFRSVLKDS